MSDQTHLNGREQRSSVAGNMAEFSYDLLTLVELQFQLFQTDAATAVRSAVLPGIAAFIAALLGLSCLPLLLFAAAAALEQYAGAPAWASFLIVAASGMLLGAAICLLSVWLIAQRMHVLSRSREEFIRNIRWVKAVLKTGGGSPHHARRAPTN